MTIVRGTQPRDVPIAIESLIVLIAMRLSARSTSVHDRQAVADALAGVRVGAFDVAPERAARIVARVVGRFACQTCLTQAFVLSVVLRRRGLDAEIVIGASRDGSSGFAAHAWLRCGDRAFFEDATHAFAPLCVIRPEAAP